MSRDVKQRREAERAVTTVEPVIRKRESHNVSRKEMDPNALTVLYRLQRSGFTAYLVGGGVRDLLLGRCPKDFDVATDAHPRQIRQLFRNAYLIGRRFRLVHIKFGPDEVIETSTFRRDPGVDEGGDAAEGSIYQHSDNTFGTPVEDALRRDFTVNALFYDASSFSIIDYVGGLEDIDRHLIRCIGDPDVRFREDPVRMLRAIRFAARLGFTIEARTYAAICRHYREISLATPPRMLEELIKLFSFGSGKPAFELLERTGLLAVLLPELSDAIVVEPYRGMFWSAMAQLDAKTCAARQNPSAGLLFAVLMLPVFRSMLEGLGRGVDTRAEDYAEVAAEVVESVALRYRMPKRLAGHLVQVFEVQRRFDQTERRGAIGRLAERECFEDALTLHRFYEVALGRPDPESAIRGRAAEGGEAEGGQEEVAPAGAEAEGARRRRRPRRRGGRRSGEVRGGRGPLTGAPA